MAAASESLTRMHALMDGDLRVRLCSGIAVVPAGEGYLFDGASRRQRIRGAAAGALRAVLPLLDGEHTGTQICAWTGLAPGDLRQLLTLLHRSGLIELWPATARAPDLSGSTADYLSRTISTVGYASVAELAAVLHSAGVLVSAANPIAGRIRADLLGAGVGWVVAGTAAADLTEIAARPLRLAIVVEPVGTDAVTAACDARGIPVLRAAATAEQLEIGPVLAAAGACAACLHDGREARFGAVTRQRSGGPAGDDIFAGLIATHALAVLARPPDHPPGTMFVHDGPDLTRMPYVVTPRPDCPRCGSGAVPESPGALAEDYESGVRLLPSWLRPRRDDSAAGLQAIETLKTTRPDFPTAPRRPLPDPAAAGQLRGEITDRWIGATVATGDDLEAVLAATLARVAGLRAAGSAGGAQPTGDRWAPSGGNLGSPEVYLLGGRPMFACPAGTLLRYDDLRHELIVPRSDLIDLGSCLASAGLPDEPPVALLFLVAGVGRLSRKYGRFAYRLAHLDAGCAMTQLAAVGAGYGLRVRHATSWRRALVDDVLELIPGQELLTSITALYESEHA